MKKFFLLCFALCLFSCEEENTSAEKPQITTETRNSTLSLQPQTNVQLLPEAKEEVERWPAYVKTQAAIEDFKNYNFKQLNANIEVLIEHIFELQQTIPSNLSVPSIEARINVMRTKSLDLQQLLKSSEIDVPTIEQVAIEIILTSENLKIQFNELYMSSPTDFEIDLDEIKAKEESLREKPETTLDSSVVLP